MKNERSDEKTSGDMLKIVLQYSAVPIAWLSSLLYIFGRIYYDSYLSYWGLSESLFPLSKEQSVIAGFFKSILYSLKLLPTLKYIMIALLSIIMAVFLSCYKPIADYLSGISRRLYQKSVPILKKNVVITPAQVKVMDGVGVINRIIAYIFILLVLSVLLFFPCKWIVDEAKKCAITERAKILSGTIDGEPFSSRATLYVRNESKAFDVYSGHLIQTSTTHAALYHKNKGVMIFPLTNVSRIEIPENGTGAKK